MILFFISFCLASGHGKKNLFISPSSWRPKTSRKHAHHRVGPRSSLDEPQVVSMPLPLSHSPRRPNAPAGTSSINFLRLLSGWQGRGAHAIWSDDGHRTILLNQFPPSIFMWDLRSNWAASLAGQGPSDPSHLPHVPSHVHGPWRLGLRPSWFMQQTLDQLSHLCNPTSFL